MPCRETPTVFAKPAFRGWLLGIVLLAAVLRVALLIYAEQRPALFDFPDSHRYIRVARNIAAGLGPIESDAIRAGTDPLYPYLLSIGVRLGLQDEADLLTFGRVVNVPFALAAVVLVAVIAWRLLGSLAALCAATILAVDPIFLFFNALVLTETCYTALLLAALCALVCMRGGAVPSADSRATDRPSTPRRGRPVVWAAAAGLCLGAATLARSSGLFMPVVLAPFVWHYSGPTRSRRLVCAAIFLLAAAGTLAPTAVRNGRLFGRFVPVRTGSGASLLEALGPWADGGPGMDRIVYPSLPETLGEYERDRICRDEALAWARRYPSQALSLAWAKLRRTWAVTINAADYASPFYRIVAWLTVAPVFVLAATGVWLLRRRAAVLGLLLAPAIYFTLLHVIFVGSVRYRVPIMPMLFVLAGAAAARFWRSVKPSRHDVPV